MRNAPTVSIVITCHNYAQYVAAAVESALAQTYPHIEVVVVDDGSTDDSIAVLRDFAAQITLIQQVNGGHVSAVNRGYAAARGDLVLFLDADDLLRPTAVATAVAAWDPECVAVQFELDVINAASELLGRRVCNYARSYDAKQINAEFALFGTYIWPVLSGNVYSRAFLEGLMPLSVERAPDGYLNTIAPLYGEVRVIAEALGMYRLHEANQSYHGGASHLGSRFAKRISLRQSELQHLRTHAQARAVALPTGNLLDHDITFINYRLMLKRLGVDYEGAAHDCPVQLWMAGMRTLAHRPLRTRLKLNHGLWLTALLCSPGWLARCAIALRFNRAALLQPIRRRLRPSSPNAVASDQRVVSH